MIFVICNFDFLTLWRPG